MPELWLVCEGGKGSVDVAVLRPIMTTLAAEIVVEPGGGHGQLSTVVRFLEAHRGGKAAYIQDRDYISSETAEAALQDNSPRFILRRHSIENYLLSSRIILRAFANLRHTFQVQRRGRVPEWLSALPADPGPVDGALRQCARRRTAEEACYLATHSLWAALPSSVQLIQKRLPAKPTIGDLSQGSPWCEALCREIENVRSNAQHASACPEFERNNVIQFFNTAYEKFTASEYVLNMEFLIDYHGRELLKEFYQGLSGQCAGLSYDSLCEKLVAAAIQEYKEDRTVFGKDDFLELANGVRRFAGLPALP